MVCVTDVVHAVYVPEEGVDPFVKFGVNTGLVTLASAVGT